MKIGRLVTSWPINGNMRIAFLCPPYSFCLLSTATAIINEGCLFLFLVATMPEARRKRYGEAVVRYALQTAYQATGISRTVLHATEAGYPLYLRLGYHPVAPEQSNIVSLLVNYIRY
jgi:GNAT superfamily N-acetyltransferase